MKRRVKWIIFVVVNCSLVLLTSSIGSAEEEKNTEAPSFSVSTQDTAGSSPQTQTSENSAEPSGASQGTSNNTPKKPSQKSKASKWRAPREKDAEGTEAPNRFSNTDIVIKSKYELNGQSLEVDTD